MRAIVLKSFLAPSGILSVIGPTPMGCTGGGLMPHCLMLVLSGTIHTHTPTHPHTHTHMHTHSLSLSHTHTHTHTLTHTLSHTLSHTHTHTHTYTGVCVVTPTNITYAYHKHN